MCTSQDFVNWVCGPEIDNRYLHYILILESETVRERFAFGTTHKTLYYPDAKALHVLLPTPTEQQAIAEVLGALDDKIAANRKLRSTIRELGSDLTRRATRDVGGSTAVGELATFLNRKRVPLSAAQRGERPGTIPYWGANGRMGWVDEPIFDSRVVLVGEDGSVVTDSGTPVIHNVWGPSWVNNHAHVLMGETVTTDLLYFLLRDAYISPQVTGAVQPKLSMKNLKSVQVKVPDNDELNQLEAVVQPLMALYRQTAEESQTLADLRDTLLPALMDGRIRVKDAQETVEEVL